MNHPQRVQKTAREWHESKPDWDQKAHEADLEAAKRRQKDFLDELRERDGTHKLKRH